MPVKAHRRRWLLSVAFLLLVGLGITEGHRRHCGRLRLIPPSRR
jgi:hypothetical protein